MVLHHGRDVGDGTEGENRELLDFQRFRESARSLGLLAESSRARSAPVHGELLRAEPPRDLPRDGIACLERRVPEDDAHPTHGELLRVKSGKEREAVVGLVASAHHRGIDVHPDGERQDQGAEIQTPTRRTSAAMRSADVTERLYSGGLRRPPM